MGFSKKWDKVVDNFLVLKTTELSTVKNALFTLEIPVHLPHVETNNWLGFTCFSCFDLGKFIHSNEACDVHLRW